jgi:homocitrate synthase NifV
MTIIDTTLRDGEQSPRVVFTREEKILIAKLLADIGIEEIEVGIPSLCKEELETISEIAKLGLPCNLLCWARANILDFEFARKTNINRLHFAIPVSDIQLNAFSKTRSWVLSRLKKLINYAKDDFYFLSVGLQDIFRADNSFARECLDIIYSLGVKRIRLSDTVGTATYFQIKEWIDIIKKNYPKLAIDVHAHNDLGTATANAFLSLQTGADFVSTTVTGIGERAGNASTEQVIMNLINAKVISCDKYNLSVLYKLAKDVAKFAKRNIEPDKPIIGENIWKHESGIHCKAMLVDRQSFEPFDINLFGNNIKAEYIIGKHTGSAIIKEILLQQGIKLEEEVVKKLIAHIKTRASIEKKVFSFEEIRAMVGELED